MLPLARRLAGRDIAGKLLLTIARSDCAGIVDDATVHRMRRLSSALPRGCVRGRRRQGARERGRAFTAAARSTFIDEQVDLTKPELRAYLGTP